MYILWWVIILFYLKSKLVVAWLLRLTTVFIIAVCVLSTHNDNVDGAFRLRLHSVRRRQKLVVLHDPRRTKFVSGIRFRDCILLYTITFRTGEAFISIDYSIPNRMFGGANRRSLSLSLSYVSEVDTILLRRLWYQLDGQIRRWCVQLLLSTRPYPNFVNNFSEGVYRAVDLKR